MNQSAMKTAITAELTRFPESIPRYWPSRVRPVQDRDYGLIPSRGFTRSTIFATASLIVGAVMEYLKALRDMSTKNALSPVLRSIVDL